MENWILSFMNDYGYIGIFLLIALENIFPPIPSEVILTFAGFMTTTSKLTISGAIAVSTLGSVAGAAALYGVGRLLDVERLERIVDRWGRFLRLSKKDLHKADAWFDKYGVWTVFFCRLVPLVRSLISIPAGMSRMKFPLFILLTTAGTLIWNTILVNAGALLGSSWNDIARYMDVFSNVVYVLLAGAALYFGAKFVKKRI
ncbi:DedA family protein [Neobacillus notoginsengisoli]|uniref:DedA family protein n=1 Tax=Neobacillus notoginsengisoli TaxID=1578198 RepID=A0A417YXV5_9BACI|nr:DedA family protein [Neobacillus notoginsengisoli]RHW42551.1 DedA family protein [Neobacillus notoginsengisoli]